MPLILPQRCRTWVAAVVPVAVDLDGVVGSHGVWVFVTKDALPASEHAPAEPFSFLMPPPACGQGDAVVSARPRRRHRFT